MLEAIEYLRIEKVALEEQRQKQPYKIKIKDMEKELRYNKLVQWLHCGNFNIS